MEVGDINHLKGALDLWAAQDTRIGAHLKLTERTRSAFKLRVLYSVERLHGAESMMIEGYKEYKDMLGHDVTKHPQLEELYNQQIKDNASFLLEHNVDREKRTGSTGSFLDCFALGGRDAPEPFTFLESTPPEPLHTRCPLPSAPVFDTKTSNLSAQWPMPLHLRLCLHQATIGSPLFLQPDLQCRRFEQRTLFCVPLRLFTFRPLFASGINSLEKLASKKTSWAWSTQDVRRDVDDTNQPG
ncbi:MAG: hypothetical protein Q9226_002731 [Calogaya cf. arnoldii]